MGVGVRICCRAGTLKIKRGKRLPHRLPLFPRSAQGVRIRESYNSFQGLPTACITRLLGYTTNDERSCKLLHNHLILSRGKPTIFKMSENAEFIRRFVDVCRTSKPAEIARLLDIPYQSAKNYVNGRIPNAAALVSISECTSCSIDWLLTGRGKKFLDDVQPENTPPASRQLEAIARRVFVEVINEMTVSDVRAQQRIVRLQSSELMSEKVMDESKTLTGREP